MTNVERAMLPTFHSIFSALYSHIWQFHDCYLYDRNNFTFRAAPLWCLIVGNLTAFQLLPFKWKTSRFTSRQKLSQIFTAQLTEDVELILLILERGSLSFSLSPRRRRYPTHSMKPRGFLVTINISLQKEISLIKHLHFFFATFVSVPAKQQLLSPRRSREIFDSPFPHFTQQRKNFSHTRWRLWIIY